jgi:hypothetical protein
VGKEMSDNEKVNVDYLENNVFIGLRRRDLRVHLNQIAFEIRDKDNSVVLVGSDALAPYMQCDISSDDRNRVEVSFEVPYLLVMSEETISKFKLPEIDYKALGLPLPEVFSFCMSVEINAAGFTHRLAWMDDRLNLISCIFGASFNFTKTN